MYYAGPHVSCYRAVSLPDGAFAGVRCVKFANLVHCPDQEGVAFVWYGEAAEPAGPSRQFGEAFVTGATRSGSATLTAHAAALVGNGERDEPFMRLRFQLSSPPPQVPTRLTVTGDRHEEWTLVPDGVLPDHQPLRRHIERGGPRLNEYGVRKDDGTPGVGVRCMLSSGSWLGAGRWLELTYLHLGTYIGDPRGPVRFSASDIAAGNGFCLFVPWGELSVRTDAEHGPSVLRASGAWSESWQLRRAARGWEPDPEVAHLRAFS
ncbi:hypothetical protein ACFVTF_22985 [Kitasatospora sp. NPDC057940]|uniref:hypothetical protein n=1 Tax=Kitasatospora sp. NPDC057940 TaxID=3346285 RepID=UPI0036DC2AEA